jgi:hemerythrin-like domain-containing protein
MKAILLPIICLSLASPALLAAAPNSTTETTVKSMHTDEHLDAIASILMDHQHIRQMIAELDRSLDSNIEKSRATFKDLKDFLVKHETMEQKLWYPELEKDASLKDIVANLKKEEEDASKEISKIDGIKDDKEWVASVKKLTKAVEHHAKEEETKLFPKARQVVSKESLNEIGAKFQEYKTKNDMKY